MPELQGHTLSKKERLSSKAAITHLMAHGRWGSSGFIKFCCMAPGCEDFSRIMVSVPKKFFKRAVKRNLLKRRIREGYRLQKDILQKQADIIFIYNSQEIASFEDIKNTVHDILRQVEEWNS